MRILSEPKNSLLRQYMKLFEMDGVRLSFEEDALNAIADQALERNTGARGLRAIMEAMMQQVMFEVPSRTDVEAVVITAAAVKGLEKPRYVLRAASLSAGAQDALPSA